MSSPRFNNDTEVFAERRKSDSSSCSSTRPSLSDHSLSPVVRGRLIGAAIQSSVPAGCTEKDPSTYARRATRDGGSSASATTRNGVNAASAANNRPANEIVLFERMIFPSEQNVDRRSRAANHSIPASAERACLRELRAP